MGLFDSIFGIDIFSTGKPDMLDDAILLGALEEDEYEYRQGEEEFDEEDEAIASGSLDEDLDY